MPAGEKIQPANSNENGGAPAHVLHHGVTNISLLNDLKLKSLRVHPQHEIPLWTLACLLLGCFLVIAGYGWAEQGLTWRQIGSMFLLLSLPLFPIEKFLKRRKIAALMADFKPLVGELEALRSSLSDYLSKLDRRTSRYFHCVTNTKVATYFMLRQIENALNALISELNDYLNHPSNKSYLKVYEKLSGTIEYRDGFEFNSGEVFHVPLTCLSARVQELVHDLEIGIEALESEIALYREQIQPHEEE